VSVRAALARSEQDTCVLFGDAQQLALLVRGEGATIELVSPETLAGLAPAPGRLRVIDTGPVSAAVLARHAPAPESGEAQLRTLRAAAAAVRSGQARALVTGPASKAAIVSAGHAFIGQTEFLAALDGRADDDVTMLFLGPTLRVALVTTHLSIARVPGAITSARVMRTVRHLAAALLRLAPARAGSILVTGLNPHAGEDGLFGGEERDVIAPALARLASEEPFCSRIKLSTALPAEAVFRAAQRGAADGVVAMFHDQATIASKLLDWGAAVNTTWGLSFLRTSVDHGVAYDAAAQGSAEHDGMLAALDLARTLTRQAHG
jgi:4-hydroxythreonine-4-phosphate dehydrogenase